MVSQPSYPFLLFHSGPFVISLFSPASPLAHLLVVFFGCHSHKEKRRYDSTLTGSGHGLEIFRTALRRTSAFKRTIPDIYSKYNHECRHKSIIRVEIAFARDSSRLSSCANKYSGGESPGATSPPCGLPQNRLNQSEILAEDNHGGGLRMSASTIEPPSPSICTPSEARAEASYASVISELRK